MKLQKLTFLILLSSLCTSTFHTAHILKPGVNHWHKHYHCYLQAVQLDKWWGKSFMLSWEGYSSFYFPYNLQGKGCFKVDIIMR